MEVGGLVFQPQGQHFWEFPLRRTASAKVINRKHRHTLHRVPALYACRLPGNERLVRDLGVGAWTVI